MINPLDATNFEMQSMTVSKIPKSSNPMRELLEGKKISQVNRNALHAAETSFNLCAKALNEDHVVTNLSQKITDLQTAGSEEVFMLGGECVGGLLGIAVEIILLTCTTASVGAVLGATFGTWGGVWLIGILIGIYLGQRAKEDCKTDIESQKHSILKQCDNLMAKKDFLIEKFKTEIQKHETDSQHLARVEIKTPELTQALKSLTQEKEKLEKALEFIQKFTTAE